MYRKVEKDMKESRRNKQRKKTKEERKCESNGEKFNLV
jgi:hypothetical protein